jgi:glycosyltransferase involved in cell wall biosynthesis
MGTLCILGVDDNVVLKDFVRAHIELLAGEKICVEHWYPDFKYRGRTIRYFYSTTPVRTRLRKLLPQAVFWRAVTRNELSDSNVHDAYAAFFRRHDVDVILAEFGPNGADIASHARRLGIPLVVHFHGHDAHRASVVEEYADRYKAMFDYAFRIVSVSNFMTDTLVTLGADRSRIIYNPYGPRDAFFDVQPDYSPTVLSVGRFTDIKANFLTLAAFRVALASCPDAKLVMVGDGELLETCRRLARTWGIESSVEFAGAVPHTEVIRKYEHACCFAQHSITPSYGDAEGTPVAILEAGAASLPVVATRHAGIHDVVVNEATGYLVDEGDVDGMGQSMAKLLADSALARRMGAAARAHVKQNYTMSRHIQSLQQTIDAARKSRLAGAT